METVLRHLEVNGEKLRKTRGETGISKGVGGGRCCDGLIDTFIEIKITISQSDEET